MPLKRFAHHQQHVAAGTLLSLNQGNAGFWGSPRLTQLSLFGSRLCQLGLNLGSRSKEGAAGLTDPNVLHFSPRVSPGTRGHQAPRVWIVLEIQPGRMDDPQGSPNFRWKLEPVWCLPQLARRNKRTLV